MVVTVFEIVKIVKTTETESKLAKQWWPGQELGKEGIEMIANVSGFLGWGRGMVEIVWK